MRTTLLKILEVALVAGIYAVLTVAVAPASYGPLQFRISEVLKSLVIWEPHLVAAFVMGNFLSNLTSPYVGPWELLFMPFANLVGASLCAWLGRHNKWFGAAVYAVIIAAAVSLMLSVILNLPFAGLFPPLLASEAVLIVGGVPVMQVVHRGIVALRGRLAPSR
ncbi:MAG: QueT transporter family protein [Armatimonadota bacterium]|nr:QueT transporter family protein [Armatimonadota bacterium]MDR5703854.1 QueT transporter family protein [Armatimonadota bacterium]MDR7435496.1 QueT transporter family protein [Armatimonadota bacterium]